jgi:hypothetical protein
MESYEEAERKKRRERWITGILFGALIILALALMCGACYAFYQVYLHRNTPEADSSIFYTQAAQTSIASATEAAGATAVAQLTQIAISLQTAQAIPSDTPAPTFSWPTQVIPTYIIPTPTLPINFPTPTPYYPPPPTSPATPCNQARFVADVTIPDGSTIPPNTRFTKIWRVQNTGACTWTTSYTLIFVSGTAMTNQRALMIPATVVPGQTIDLSVDMVSPSAAGTYTSNWMFRDPFGQIFGVNPNGNSPLFVRIRVPSSPKPDPAFAYDFSANYCNAQWRTGAGQISCTTPSNDPRGSVTYLTDPDLETRTENEPGLWTRPDQSSSGYISGQYPPYTVKPGDFFVTELSCKYGFSGCNIIFRVDYVLPNGAAYNLGVWGEVSDKDTTILELPLSSLAGQSVQFILRMQNNGNVSQANGIWFLPSIRNYPATTTPLPATVTPTPTRTLAPTATETPTIPPTSTIPYPYPLPSP